MSQRLLRKSRTNLGEMSQSQSHSHTSPVMNEDGLRNFRIEFSDLSRKRLSDSGEVKDPTIYSQKRKSRLSQFSNFNPRQRDQSDHNLSVHQYTATTKQYYQLKWKELSGLPKQTDLQQILRTFLVKLKRNANIWDQINNKYSYLKETYLQDEVRLQSQYISYMRQSFHYIRLLSLLTVPIQAGTLYIDQWIQGLIILFLVIEFIDQLLKIKLVKLNVVCNFIYIASTLLLNFDINQQGKIVLMILSLSGVQYQFQWSKCTLAIILLIYINYFANFWLLINDNDNTYLDSIIWTINNCLPFTAVDAQIEGYSNKIISVAFQIISFYFQILFISIFVKFSFSTNEQELFIDFLKVNKVDQNLIDEAQDILISNVHSNELQTVNNLMQQLPINIQKPLFFLIKSKKLHEIEFFTQYFSKQSIDEIAFESVLKFCKPNEVIVEKGQQDEYVYVVLQGEMGIYDNNTYLQSLPMNQAFGIENLIMNQGHNLTMRSKGNSILIQINHTKFLETIKKINCDLETFHSIKNEVLFMNRVELLLQHCYVCGSYQHLSSLCNRVHISLNKNLVISRHLYTMPQKRKKFDRKWDQRVNSLYNFKLVRSCGRRLKRNYGIVMGDAEGYERGDQEYEEEDEEEVYQGHLSYKDLTNPSRSVEVVSGQTLRDIIYHDHIDNEEQLQYYQQQWQQQQDINRHQAVKQTIQTAGFQNEDLYFGDAINIPLQHKQFTQNSNTFKSSSGQTYQSQKSQQVKQQQQNQQQQQQQVQQQIPYQSKTYVQSPLGTNQFLIANNRNAQPKLTFSYDPFYHEQNNKQTLPQPQPEYQAMMRPQFRSSTNYIPSGPTQLPVVSEERDSQLNIPQMNVPYASAISISSVGISSIDDIQRRDGQNNTYTGPRRMTQKQTNTITSTVSPDIQKKKSISGSNSRSYSALSSRQNQHYSDLDNVIFRYDVKDNFDIDQIGIYQQFKPMNNYDCVVNQIKIQSKKLIKQKKIK
ncbi:unnamed protein product [Paramecium octaurelia]|uniref:Cyclic nucleotide-binding domain-containing protein n=1 Tax=Paramecium octaurelia TaxID=43137 RepID=A0A8S1V436_PAROT|nr:unnamed protein product [Paramecium octaurelia]